MFMAQYFPEWIIVWHMWRNSIFLYRNKEVTKQWGKVQLLNENKFQFAIFSYRHK